MSDHQVNSRDILRRWYARAQEEGMPDTVLQKRTAVRITWYVLIEVRGGDKEPIQARIRDVTGEGLGIQCRVNFRERSELRIRLADQPDEFLDGVVVHCTETIGGFKIGIIPR